MGLSINQIVHLEQVDVVNTEVLKRLGDLLLSSFFAFDTYLGCQIKLVSFAFNGRPNRLLRCAVPSGRVDKVDVVGQ